MYNKQLNSVFVISGIIKVSASVIIQLLLMIMIMIRECASSATKTSHKITRDFKKKSDRKSSNFRFYWTKICTRVILSILQSFLHFFKAKYINNCQK